MVKGSIRRKGLKKNVSKMKKGEWEILNERSNYFEFIERIRKLNDEFRFLDLPIYIPFSEKQWFSTDKREDDPDSETLEVFHYHFKRNTSFMLEISPCFFEFDILVNLLEKYNFKIGKMTFTLNKILLSLQDLRQEKEKEK